MSSVSIHVATLVASSTLTPHLKAGWAVPGQVAQFFAEQIDKKHFEIYIYLL